MKFLNTTDSYERQMMWAITRKSHELHEAYAKTQAAFIQEGIAKLFGGK